MASSTHRNVHVKKCGLLVFKELNFIGASPDGLVTCCCGSGLLEIKCPFSLRYADPKISSPPYIRKDSDGNLFLKESHSYYSQIQLQIAVWEKEWCDFFCV